GRVRVGRDDFDEVEGEALAELFRELHAAADGMIEPDLDQAFADGERDQALRRLTRDVELARDLFLVVAGDIVKPTRTCGVVEPPPTLILPIAHCRCRPTAKARRMGASLTAKLSAGASAQLAFGCRSRPRGGLGGLAFSAIRISRSVSSRCARMAAPAPLGLPSRIASKMARWAAMVSSTVCPRMS